MAASSAKWRLVVSAFVVVWSVAWLGCASGGSGGGGAEDVTDLSTTDEGGQAEAAEEEEQAAPELISRNEGGGDLATRMGGATFAGEAAGPLANGILSMTLSADGVVTELGGTVLGSFFGLPLESEVFFNLDDLTVSGTYVAGSSTRPLEDYLTEAGKTIELRQIVVNLVGDSFSARMVYRSDLTGQSAGDQTIDLQATLKFQTNDQLLGTILLPGYFEDQNPAFTLERL